MPAALLSVTLTIHTSALGSRLTVELCALRKIAQLSQQFDKNFVGHA